MKKLFFLLLVAAVFTVGSGKIAASADYPEFTGNYIQCGSKWCAFDTWELDTMMLWEVLSVDKQGRKGSNTVSYAGFFEVPDNIIVTDEKPRILLYSGKASADPQTAALVEFGRLPFNNAKISSVNREDYGMKIRYASENVKMEMKTYLREIPLRYKPIEGKVGMFLYEPSEPLSDGLYVIDAGLPTVSGHDGLTTAPGVMNFLKAGSVQTAIPFIVGKVDEEKMTKNVGIPQPIEASHETGRSEKEEPKSPSKSEKTSIEDAVEDVADQILKGIFGKKSK